ncbi:MAG TPA: DnaJ domain-containing protein [Coleofasciculaceae cyanobacterium]|jgi:hypothetical protein
MSQSAFFTQHDLPVFEYLSTDSKRRLDLWFADGNSPFRQKKLLEFFKAIDWISPEDACDDRPLQKLEPGLRSQLNREIEDYRMSRAVKRVENAEKREQYRLRIFEYFRIKMPAADKALLESLRDYELDLTGRDVNWRHYFTLDSFRKIDAFIQATPGERQELFARFRKDVETYQRNYEKIHQAQAGRGCEHEFTFDDWCDMMGDESPRGGRKKRQETAAGPASNPVLLAFQTLELSWGASPDLVKKQFRRLTLSHHPDLAGGSEEKMKAIVAAYQEIQRYLQVSACV